MDKFYLPIQVRWSDIDQNRHLRHSAYYDYGATVRIACFSQHGLTNLKFEELRIGPILFREEAVFKREIKFEDSITVDLFVTKATHDFRGGACAITSLKRTERWQPLSIWMERGWIFWLASWPCLMHSYKMCLTISPSPMIFS